MCTTSCDVQVYHDVDRLPICPHKKFFYVNGVGTSAEMARKTGGMLSEMFNRHTTVVYNPTNSAAIDLLDVFIQKVYRTGTRYTPRFRTAPDEHTPGIHVRI